MFLVLSSPKLKQFPHFPKKFIFLKTCINITVNYYSSINSRAIMSDPKKDDDKEEMKNVSRESEELPAANQSTSADDSLEEASQATASGIQVDQITRYLAEKLGFYTDDTEKDSKSKKEKAKKKKILSSKDIDGIVEYINSNKCKNIVTMAGAGISTAAGIPDFRSPVSGLYHNLEKYNLPHPQAIFELDFFLENPKPFFVLAKELYPGTFKPTLSHYFIRMLHEKGFLLRHYTQNIDTLERVADIPGEKLIEAHGTFHLGHCTKCRKEHTQEWMKESIFRDEIPTCTGEDCEGVVKPDIVFFGENLPDKFHNCLTKDCSKCDLLIVLGSSLVVQPFASLVDRVPKKCPRLLINREKAGEKSRLMDLMGIGGGMNFDDESDTRDVAWIGDCDAGCEFLADKLGWGDELRELLRKEHERIDELNKKEEEEEKDSKETPPKL